MSVAGGPDIITDDLVMYLDSTNIKSYPGSGTTWFDLSGNSNNGTLTNGAIITNGLLVLDGLGERTGTPTGAYVAVDNAINKTNNYANGCTWIWWMYMFAAQPHGQRIFHYSSTINHIEIKSEGPSGYFRTEAALNNGYSFGTSSPPGGIPIQTWHNFAIVWDNVASPRTVNWYKNGELVYTHANFDSGTGGTGEYCSFSAIGRAGGTELYLYTESFYGYVPVVQIYGNKLTAAEVKQNYDATKGRFGL